MGGETEPRENGDADLDGAIFSFVEAKCGALPCGPYIDGYELTCAVCSLPSASPYSGR